MFCINKSWVQKYKETNNYSVPNDFTLIKIMDVFNTSDQKKERNTSDKAIYISIKEHRCDIFICTFIICDKHRIFQP